MTHRLSLFALVSAIALAQPASAIFHDAVIDEVMTSYGGDSTIQFVEIRMLSGGQNIVGSSQLGVFDAGGSYLGSACNPATNVPNGTANGRWLMASGNFASSTGLTPDFTFTGLLFLPTAGGMVCWGKPGVPSNPDQYIDCVSYGSYLGSPNSHTSAPAALTAEGHSLVRGSRTNSSLNDFSCADPATPTRNNPAGSVNMSATSACPATPTVTPPHTPTLTATITPTPSPVLTCAPSPRTICKTPVAEKGSFKAKLGSTPEKDSFGFSWKGQSTSLGDIGNPTATTHYAICVYDSRQSLPIMTGAVPAGGTCSGKACWKALGATPNGYKFKDKLGSNYGITQISVKTGEDGKAKVQVKGKGSLLNLPSLPFDQTPSPLRVQVINSLGSCWGSSYSDPPGSDPNDPAKFKDKND